MSNGVQTYTITAIVVNSATRPPSPVTNVTSFGAWTITEQIAPGEYEITTDADFGPGAYFIICMAPGFKTGQVSWSPGQAAVEFELTPNAGSGPSGSQPPHIGITSISAAALEVNLTWAAAAGAGGTLQAAGGIQIFWDTASSQAPETVNASNTGSAGTVYFAAGTYPIKITVHQTDGQTASATAQVTLSANLLQNASFESSAVGWFKNNLANAVNMAQYNPGPHGAGYAHDGSGFLEMNTSQPGGSVAQNAAVYQLGGSYSFSVWLRVPPNSPDVSGSVVLWGLGGTEEKGSTSFTVGEQWTLVTATLDIQQPGHNSLRGEIYMETTGANLDADGAQLVNAGLQNASFESSAAGWFKNNLASSVLTEQYNPGPYGAGYAHDGSGYFGMYTSQPGGSVAQNVVCATGPGQNYLFYPQPDGSYSFSVWLRAEPREQDVSGSVVLWGLGGTEEKGSTSFTVGDQWTLVTATLDIQQPGHNSLRGEIYIETTGANLDADGAQLVNAGLQNASFESSAAGWFKNNLANAVNMTQYNPGSHGAGYAHDGSGFLEMNTSQPGGSVAQNVACYPQPEGSYSFSVWLRVPPNSPDVSGSVVLWGLGGTEEKGSTSFTVGEQWTLVTATLDIQQPGHNSLRGEIYMETTGANLDADACTTVAGEARY